MRYNGYDEDYGNYGRRDSRGRYMEYGRRGVPGSGRGRYRGDDAMDEMRERYMDYNEGRGQYERGNYNGEDEMIEATEGIMENIVEIVKELSESKNPQVMQIIQKKAREIGQM